MTTERPAPPASAPSSAPSPDRPPVPRSRLSTGAIALAVFGALGVATYGGIAFFALAFLVIRMVTPFSVRKEIEEDQNTALAIIIGSVVIGIALIISAAVHG